ncbi:hypothetical protein [Nocardiopsis gilva]|uniref:hypothetical protein n=1 Tax=Nocardiopsis gilva TaxID=280236 RepID=UPI0018DF564C
MIGLLEAQRVVRHGKARLSVVQQATEHLLGALALGMEQVDRPHRVARLPPESHEVHRAHVVTRLCHASGGVRGVGWPDVVGALVDGALELVGNGCKIRMPSREETRDGHGEPIALYDLAPLGDSDQKNVPFPTLFRDGDGLLYPLVHRVEEVPGEDPGPQEAIAHDQGVRSPVAVADEEVEHRPFAQVTKDHWPPREGRFWWDHRAQLGERGDAEVAHEIAESAVRVVEVSPPEGDGVGGRRHHIGEHGDAVAVDDLHDLQGERVEFQPVVAAVGSDERNRARVTRLDRPDFSPEDFDVVKHAVEES